MGLNNPGGIKGAVKPVCKCVLQNGGFETGAFPPWQVGYDAVISSDSPAEGSYCAKLGPNRRSYMCQAFTCSAEKCNLHFKAKGAGGLGIWFYGEYSWGYPITMTPDWTEYIFPWHACDTETDVEICITPSAGGDIVYVDDVYFTDIALSVSGKVFSWRLFPVANEGLQITEGINKTVYSNHLGLYNTGTLPPKKNYTATPTYTQKQKYIPTQYTYHPLCNEHTDQDFIQDYFEYINICMHCLDTACGSQYMTDVVIELYAGDYTGTQGEPCQAAYPFGLDSKLTVDNHTWLMWDCWSSNITVGPHTYNITDEIIDHLRDHSTTDILNIRSRAHTPAYVGTDWTAWETLTIASKEHTDIDKRPYIEMKLWDGRYFKIYPIGDAYYYNNTGQCWNTDILYSAERYRFDQHQTYDFFLSFNIAAALVETYP